MKRILILGVLSFISAAIFAQIQNPVTWTYSADKKSEKVYQITITATLPRPWHIYSQTTPKGGPIPTRITFNKNPLLVLSGQAKEVGSLKVDHDPNFGIDVKYFYDKVEFVQLVTLKAALKTNLSGSIEYMVCNDSQCLPPTRKSFDIKIQ